MKTSLPINDDVVRKATGWSAAAALEHINEGNSDDEGALLALMRAGVTPSPTSAAPALGFEGRFAGQERRPPQWRGWLEEPPRTSELTAATAHAYLARSWWRRDKLQVVSALAVFTSAVGPEWKVAVRRVNAERPKRADVGRVLRDFGMTEAFEYNPYPSSWQTHYLSVNPDSQRGPRPDIERLVIERDGYSWWTPREGPCRGCIYALASKQPCPIHGSHSTVSESGAR